MSDLTKRPFWESKNVSFQVAVPECDLLHPESRIVETGYALTETQYLGFNIPEERIHGLCYVWHHPNLGVVTGGAWVWQGVKQHNLQSELFDIVTFMSDECLKNDLYDYRLENSYHVNTIEPLKKHRIRYQDTARGNAFDIELEALMPAMVLGSGTHLEQGMKTRGWLQLRGKDYKVDGYTVRDRSWGQLRSEAHQPFPPMAWMCCVFSPDFAFGCTAYDSVESDPEWKGILQLPDGDNTKGGWIYRDGEYTAVVAALKKTRRNRETLFPEHVDMTLTDAKGRQYQLSGEIIGTANWRTWHNFESIICLTRWTYEGNVSHGDVQECQWAEYIRLFHSGRG